MDTLHTFSSTSIFKSALQFFLWTNEKGILWRDILRANAKRREFEEARFERDLEVIACLLVGGRDAVETTVDKVVEKHRQFLERWSTDDNPRLEYFIKYYCHEKMVCRFIFLSFFCIFFL